MDRNMALELTEQEHSLLLNLCRNVSVQGTEAMRLVISIEDKLKAVGGKNNGADPENRKTV